MAFPKERTDLPFRRSHCLASRGLNIDIVDVILIKDSAQRRPQWDQDLIVLVGTFRRNALWLENAQHFERNPLDPDDLTDGIVCTKEVLSDSGPEHHNAFRCPFLFGPEEFSGYQREIPDLKIVRCRAQHLGPE